MILLMYFDYASSSSSPGNMLIYAELRNDLGPEMDGIVENESMEGLGDAVAAVQHDADTDEFINQVLNDPGKVYADRRTGQIVTTGAEGEPHVRYIPPSGWKIRVRPALMRAAETSHLFNV